MNIFKKTNSHLRKKNAFRRILQKQNCKDIDSNLQVIGKVFAAGLNIEEAGVRVLLGNCFEEEGGGAIPLYAVPFDQRISLKLSSYKQTEQKERLFSNIFPSSIRNVGAGKDSHCAR